MDGSIWIPPPAAREIPVISPFRLPQGAVALLRRWLEEEGRIDAQGDFLAPWSDGPVRLRAIHFTGERPPMARGRGTTLIDAIGATSFPAAPLVFLEDEAGHIHGHLACQAAAPAAEMPPPDEGFAWN